MMLDKIKIPLQFSILSIFVTLFIISLVGVMYITTKQYAKALLVVSANDLSQVTSATDSEIKSILEPTRADTELSARLIQNKMLDVNEVEELYVYTFNLLRGLPYSEMVYWGDQQGNFVISRRQSDGSINTSYINPIKHPGNAVK